MPAIPDEPAFPFAVKRNPKGEDTREGVPIAGYHDAGGDAGRDGFGHESGFSVGRGVVAQGCSWCGPEHRVPFQAIARA